MSLSSDWQAFSRLRRMPKGTSIESTSDGGAQADTQRHVSGILDHEVFREGKLALRVKGNAGWLDAQVDDLGHVNDHRLAAVAQLHVAPVRARRGRGVNLQGGRCVDLLPGYSRTARSRWRSRRARKPRISSVSSGMLRSLSFSSDWFCSRMLPRAAHLEGRKTRAARRRLAPASTNNQILARPYSAS